MIKLNAVTKQYGSLTAVDSVSFSVKTGEYFALLGPNGAGKTTIVKMLLDFTQPTSGSLSINSILSTQAASRTAIGYLAENHHIPPHLSGWQYLQRCAELLNIDRSDATDQCRRIVKQIGMEGRENTKASTYSKGMIQRFGMGAALLGHPKLLLLDEPLLGLSPAYQEIVINGTKAIRDSKGISIIITEQYARPVMPIIDHGYILENGSSVLAGTREELMDNPDVKSAYFGV